MCACRCLDGIAATRRIVAEALPTRVLVLMMFDEDAIVYDAMRAGASGFLLKSAPPAKLGYAVRTVAAGEALLAPTITRRLIQEFVSRPPPGQGRPRATSRSLTERELEALPRIARGLSNGEIAETLVVSPATVKTHVNHTLQKLRPARSGAGRRARRRDGPGPPRGAEHGAGTDPRHYTRLHPPITAPGGPPPPQASTGRPPPLPLPRPLLACSTPWTSAGVGRLLACWSADDRPKTVGSVGASRS